MKDKNNQSDHDLLITLNVKVDGLTKSVSDMRDGTTEKLTTLEHRVSKIEDDIKVIGGIEPLYKRFSSVESYIENERRTRNLWRFVYSTIGSIVGFVISLIALRSGLLNLLK